MKIVGDIKDKNILLLQGPMGTFFRKLGGHFTQHGATIHTICFNGGDQFFALSQNCFLYQETPADWPSYINGFLRKHRIDTIFLFGNCRYYHKEAALAAQKAEIEVFVFEEGYVRPHFITLEKNGVNGDSTIADDPLFYAEMDAADPVIEHNAENSYLKMAAQAALYVLTLKVMQGAYPYYRHHRELSLLKELCYGIRGLYRKTKYSFTERHLPDLFQKQLKNSYFLVPLQTRTDFQIKEYSRFDNIEEFIDEVLESFSQHSPPETLLVFKHHPLERGMPSQTEFIQQQSSKYGIPDRVLITHDIHLPTCLKNAKGAITINSTVGFSSLFHETPTKVLGQAVYDIEGLTCKNMSLDQFWTDCRKPDRELSLKFRNYVISTTQLNGGFYGKFPDFSE
jgi:capsular polysaccharide export protein